MVVIGFHPSNAGLRYELATPLLIGNILRWLAPESFRNLDLSASSVGTVNAELPTISRRITSAWCVRTASRCPSASPDVRCTSSPGRRGSYGCSPEPRIGLFVVLARNVDQEMGSPSNVRRGLPAFRESLDNPRDLWQLLAILGALAFILEWILYGRMNRLLQRPVAAVTRGLKKAS